MNHGWHTFASFALFKDKCMKAEHACLTYTPCFQDLKFWVVKTNISNFCLKFVRFPIYSTTSVLQAVSATKLPLHSLFPNKFFCLFLSEH